MSNAEHAGCGGLCGRNVDHADQMDRRAFLSAAAAASVTLALAACGDGQIGGITGVPGGLGTGTITVTLANFPALAAIGGVARVTTTGAPVAVYRSGAATYQAFSMSCPHKGTMVNITAAGYTCPNHTAKFAKDGVWLSGQRTTALLAMPSTYDPAAGTLTITGVSTTTPPGGDDDDDDDDVRAP
jgi:Rieske Fe-S protein